MSKVNKVDQEKFEKVKNQQSRKDPNSLKSRMYAKFDEVEPGDGALEVEPGEDERIDYIQSLASQYNREEQRPEIKLRTMKTADESKIYIYAIDSDEATD